KRVSNEKWNGKDPREAMADLSDMWRGFLDLRLLKRIKKAGGRVYMKTVEPHGSGVPHVHIMMWIPKSFIVPLKKVFKAYFAGRTTFKYKFDGDEGGAVAYIMKYINKTFRHAQTDEMTDEAYWCAFHGIRRFTTSRTLPALKYFRKCNYDDRYKSYFEFSKAVFGNSLAICFNGEYIYRREWYDDDWWDETIFLKHHAFEYKEPFNMPLVSLKKDRVQKEPQNDTPRLYIGKHTVYHYPTPIFSKMSHQELNMAYSDLKSNYNPFVDFEVERLRVCEREYKKRFEFD
ncbi:MAG TPA: replication endonuclease, partial [Campylobacterales bacterium]|nr:replication endonuclease [Campylobacterales bacterium]